MKRMRACAALLVSACFIAACTPPASTPHVVASTADTSKDPAPNTAPENAIYGNTLPRELQGFTFFGQPAANYTVTVVTPRLFERFVSFNSTLSAPEPTRNEPADEDEPSEYPSECEIMSAYHRFDTREFMTSDSEARCAGEYSGTSIPGIRQNGRFTPLTGYEEHIDTSKNWDVVVSAAEENMVVWYMTPTDEGVDTLWTLFSTDLHTRKTSYLGNNNDPIFEQKADPTYNVPPYTGTIVDGRFLFTLSTTAQDTDLIWEYPDSSGTDVADDNIITEALFSIRLDGSDARKELDSTMLFDPYGNAQEPLIIAAREDTYALLKRTKVDTFTEIFSTGWNTEYRPYPLELAQWRENGNGQLVLTTGQYILVAQEADQTLAIVDNGLNVGDTAADYHHEPEILGDYLVWSYYHWDNDVTGIYALNRTNHRGVMTLLNSVPDQPALEGNTLRIPLPANEDRDGNPLYRNGTMPLP